MKALIDGDLIVYRVGFTVENEDEWIAIARTNDTIRLILAETNCDDFKIYLSDSANNFRLKLYPAYKANRVQPKPKHYQAIKDHLIKEWGAIVSLGQEADDALGINQTTDTIICSIDKDLYQIPGEHYNFVTKVFKTVSPEEGLRYFYNQLLTGDRTDNIPGIYGIGPKKAEKALTGLSDELAFYEKVVEMYCEYFMKENELIELSEIPIQQIKDTILRNGRLLKIRQQEEELWSLPEQRGEVPSQSTPSMHEVSEKSTEPMTQEIQN